MKKEPVRIIAEPPLFEEWLEREIEDAERELIRRELGKYNAYLEGIAFGYLAALRRVRQELENGG